MRRRRSAARGRSTRALRSAPTSPSISAERRCDLRVAGRARATSGIRAHRAPWPASARAPACWHGAFNGHSHAHTRPARTFAALCSALVVVAAAACAPPVCTLEARASLDVHVADEAGAAVVRASHEGGAPQDCASSGQGAYQCPFEEVAGAFTVTAEKDGFTSDSADVDVEEDECHVTPARVDLVLSPTG